MRRKAVEYPEWEYDEEERCINAACLGRWAKEALLWLLVVGILLFLFGSVARLHYAYQSNLRIAADKQGRNCRFLDEVGEDGVPICDRAAKEAEYGGEEITDCERARTYCTMSVAYRAYEMTSNGVKEYFFPSEVSRLTTVLIVVSIFCLLSTLALFLLIYMLCVRARGSSSAGSTYYIQPQPMYAAPEQRSQPNKWEYEDEGSDVD